MSPSIIDRDVLPTRMSAMKSTLSTLPILLCAAVTVACGSSDDADGGPDNLMGDGGSSSGGTGGTGGTAGIAGSSGDSAQPSNLLDGILTGTTGTMPCEQPLDSGFEGDELCILPVESSVG